MSNFATMLAFFSDTVEITCLDCDKIFVVDTRDNHRKKLCSECAQKRIDERVQRRLENSRCSSFGEPSLDLAFAVVDQAVKDMQSHKDYSERGKAREFLGAEDGAQLWLRCAGIPVDEDTIKGFKLMSETGKRGIKNRQRYH